MSIESDVYHDKVLGGTGCVIEELYVKFISDSDYIPNELFPKNSYVLDLGCGTGDGCAFLKKTDNIVVGTDVSLMSLRAFRDKNLYSAVSDFSFGSAPFKTATFDFVYITEVLEHVTNPYALIKEAKRVCKPNGLFHISIPNFTTQLQGYGGNQHSFIYPGLFTKENFSIFLKQMYLKIFYVRDFNHPRAHTITNEGKKIDALHHYFICQNQEINKDIVEVVSSDYEEKEIYGY